MQKFIMNWSLFIHSVVLEFLGSEICNVQNKGVKCQIIVVPVLSRRSRCLAYHKVSNKTSLKPYSFAKGLRVEEKKRRKEEGKCKIS